MLNILSKLSKPWLAIFCFVIIPLITLAISITIVLVSYPLFVGIKAEPVFVGEIYVMSSKDPYQESIYVLPVTSESGYVKYFRVSYVSNNPVTNPEVWGSKTIRSFNKLKKVYTKRTSNVSHN